MPVKFVILSAPRSGTGYLKNMLNSSSSIVCDGEIFHKNETIANNALNDLTKHWLYQAIPLFRKIFRNKTTALNAFRNQKPVEFLNSFYSYNRCEAIGFKIFKGHQEQVREQLIADPAIKKIILYRKNTLQVHVSELIANATNKWILKEGDPSLVRVEVQPDTFKEFHKNYTTFFSDLTEQLEKSNQTFLVLTYEDITNSFPAEQIFSFLEIPYLNEHLTSELKKQNPFRLSEMISNYTELETVFSGTELKSFLNA